LVEKLGIKPGTRIAILNAPRSYRATLGRLPPGVVVASAARGTFPFIHFFTRSRTLLESKVPLLVRALEPGPGVGRCSGPGLVTRALQIDRALNGAPLRPPDLYLLDDDAPRRRVFVTPRVGVQGTGRWEKRLLRYCVDSPSLSRPIPRRGR